MLASVASTGSLSYNILGVKYSVRTGKIYQPADLELINHFSAARPIAVAHKTDICTFIIITPAIAFAVSFPQSSFYRKQAALRGS